jgi:beta-lactamase class A
MKRWMTVCLCASVLFVMCCGLAHAQDVAASTDEQARSALRISHDTAGDLDMTMALGRLDTAVRRELVIEAEQTAVGLLDLTTGRLAMLRADTMFYAASIPKITILLTYFQTHPQAGVELDDATRHELGLMIKRSDNAAAAKYSQSLGFEAIADVLTSPAYKLYDPLHGGGLWMGKHYAKADERNRDPLAGESHAATVRQLLRYYLMLEQGRLVSPQVSRTMREIFESPDIEHLNSKIVLGLAGRDVQIIRKSGTWSDWYSDSAIITGGDGRHYALAVLTHTPANPAHDPPRAIGDEYTVTLSRCIDDWAIQGFKGEIPRAAPASQPEAN